MKKMFSIITMLAMVLLFGSQAMAEDAIPPSFIETSFDSRIYHESHGPGSSVGGWKLGLNWWHKNPDIDLPAWENSVREYDVEFIKLGFNNVEQDSFYTKPRYCYNTVQKIDGINTEVRSCDAYIWFGNRLNVTEGSQAGQEYLSVFKIKVDGNYLKDMEGNDITVSPASDSQIQAFAFPEVLGGKNAMVVTLDGIKVTYTTPIIPRTYLRIEVFDTNRSDIVYRKIITQGAQKVHSVPLVVRVEDNDISLSGHYARLQMFTDPADGPIVRKSTWIKLP